ncbi:MAG TPA: hypothetical protein VF412_00785 [Bdellovibrio sp.]|uniref:hypothetical protein n=1 Tax=Bdellovibrio sp. TaxID=28201 RepID=UPI002F01E1F1
MKKPSIILASALLIMNALAPRAFAQTQNSSFANDETFLERLGFEKYTQEIQFTLDHEQLNAVSQKVLLGNKDRYQIVDIARDMSLQIYEAIKWQLYNPQIRKKAVRLTGHLLRPHALLTDVPLPDSLKTLSKDQFSKAREAYLTQVATQRFEEERTKILATIVDLMISSQQVSGQSTFTEQNIMDMFQANVSQYLRMKYQYMEMQNTQYWGRAMAALLVHHSRMDKQPEIEKDLQFVLSKQNDSLGNYLSDVQSLRNSDQKVQTFTLQSGDFANEYSHGTEAFYITIGVRPGDSANQRIASKNKLMGSLWQVAMYATPSDEEAIVAKVRTNQPLTSREKRKFSRMKKAISTNGWSHVGIVEVKKDTESGISMPWIWDIYPNSDVGGIRFIGPEGFAFQERFQKVGYARYDSAKFMSYYKDSIAKRGYQENVWSSFDSVINDNNEIASDLQKPLWIKTRASAQDVEMLASYPLSQADQWYKGLIIPRVLNMMKNYLVSKDAMGFASGFANAKGAAYCSQALVLAYLQSIDVDPQETQDKWSNFLLMTKKFNLDASNYFDLSARIISPSGFAWQAKLVQSETTVLLDSQHRRTNYYDINMDLLTSDKEISKDISSLVTKDDTAKVSLDPVLDDDDL